MPIMPALRRLRKEFLSSRSLWAIEQTCQKKKNTKESKRKKKERKKETSFVIVSCFVAM
jgi:hypothetical protein